MLRRRAPRSRTRRGPRRRSRWPGSTSATSLGIDKTPGDTRVVVAMSGGVDSSGDGRAAEAEQGYDVVGVTLQLYDHGADPRASGRLLRRPGHPRRRQVAERLGIPHYVLDYESRFRDAGDRGLRRQPTCAGETPIPCVRCNQTVKFRDLLATGARPGRRGLATGHYVRRVEGPPAPSCIAAPTRPRPELFPVRHHAGEQLDFLRFPLGDLPKPRRAPGGARSASRSPTSPTARTSASCPTATMPVIERLRRRLRPEAAAEPGDIVHVDGRCWAATRASSISPSASAAA
jgi:tRNA-specific 2-thiouridylase